VRRSVGYTSTTATITTESIQRKQSIKVMCYCTQHLTINAESTGKVQLDFQITVANILA
jgi:hypothetical protein